MKEVDEFKEKGHEISTLYLNFNQVNTMKLEPYL